MVIFLLLGVLAQISLQGQVRREMGRTTREVDPLDQSESQQFLQNFRSSRGGLDSIFEGRLIHYPRRGKKVTMPVRIYSGWSGRALKMRIDLDPEGFQPTQRFLFVGGSDPQGWAWTFEGEVISLPPEDLFQPLFPDLDLTAFDLTAPYLDWPNALYDGSERVADSPAHWFRFEPPTSWVPVLQEEGIVAVRVALDARFDAPVRVEYLDSEDNPVRSLEVRSFKKIDDTWIVRRLEGFDERTRNRTELRIDDAEVELELQPQIFLPSSLSIPAGSILSGN
ncbi:outer membrane lipoprotein-sorting protein [Puniceicoccus vermicola]